MIDRQISQGRDRVIDSQSNKICVVLCRDALVSIAYTGVAVTHETWLDCVVANKLVHRQLGSSLAQPGSHYLARSINTIVRELALNLNGMLNTDDAARICNLQLSIVGWHIGREKKPLAWELCRGPIEQSGNRFFQIRHHKVGKFLRQFPKGLWSETIGDVGKCINEKLMELKSTESWTHDDVERFIRRAIVQRSAETITVGTDCVAIQLDPYNAGGEVQFTYYPGNSGNRQHPLISPWVLTPRMICAPSQVSSSCSETSECGNYVVGGFEDGDSNLSIKTRLPVEYKQEFRGFISMEAQTRPKLR
jgi:hypothetical protein